MSIEALSENILNVVEEFDRSSAPYGLYALRDILLLPRPKEALGSFPTLIECRPDLASANWFAMQMTQLSEWAKQKNPHFEWESNEFGTVRMNAVKISKIKVREYGSSYKVDKNESFPTRWEELKMDKEISQLYARGGYREKSTNLQILLFIGFDKAQRPFEREFAQLKPHQNLEAHGVTFVSRQWEDVHNRGFSVRTALWACP